MTYKTIDNFKLHEVLSDTDVIEFTDQFGDVMRHKEWAITEGVTLFVYDSGQAALEFPDHISIDFMWTGEVANMFDSVDDVKALELFDTLLQNGITAD